MPVKYFSLQPTFHISAPINDSSSAHLVLESGPQGISIVILDGNNSFAAVIVYAFPAGSTHSEYLAYLEEIMKNEQLMAGVYKKIDIIWTFPETILVPPEHMKQDLSGELLDLVFGDLEKTGGKTDFLFRHNIHNIYRVPSVIEEAFVSRFPFAGQTHQYSLLAEMVKEKGNHLLAVFYTNSVTVLFRKEGQLQLIRNFGYQEPEGAAWCLLNVCERFEAGPDDTVLHLSGMIDTGSNLYAALYKYFLHIELEALPGTADYTDAIKKQPSHYFSHLFASALCV